MSTQSSLLLSALPCLALLAFGSACGDDTGTGGAGGDGGSATGAGGLGGSDGGGGTGGEAPVTVTISGNVIGTEGPVTDGDVCFVWTDGEACADNDAQARYSITDAPTATQGSLRFRGAEIATSYLLLATEQSNIVFNAGIAGVDKLDGDYTKAGVTRTTEGVAVFGFGVAGAALELEPESGTGPLYYLADDSISDTATETDSNRVGLYLNVDPADGPFVLRFDIDGTDCTTPMFGGPLTAWNIPADAEVAFLGFSCN
jgi:hypothetical protein